MLLSGSGQDQGAFLPASCACGVCGGFLCTDTGRFYVSADLGIGQQVDGAPDGFDMLYELKWAEQDWMIGGPLPGGDGVVYLGGGDGEGGGEGGGGDGSPRGGPEVDPDRFNIDLNYVHSFTGAQQTQIRAAADRWEEIILGDLPAFNVPGVGVVDDLRINVRIANWGSGGALAAASVGFVRPGSNLPLTGTVWFNSHFLPTLTSTGNLAPVMTHEVGHVLGIGTLPQWNGQKVGSGTSNPGWVGPTALSEWNRLVTINPSSVPLEGGGGGGTAESHWRESILDHELMTGWFNWGQFNPLSRVSAAAMLDLGYHEVNIDAADLYQVPSTISYWNDLPSISSVSASPNPSHNQALVLTANNVTDFRGGVSHVEFFRETNGMPGLQTTLSASDLLVGVDNSPTGGWSITIPAGQLPDGESLYYARVVDNHGAYSAVVSVSHLFVPDADPPEITSANFQFQWNHTLAYEFSEPVVGLSGSDLQVFNQTTGQWLNSGDFTFNLAGNGQSATWLFDGIMPDGRYVATIPAGSFTDAAGNPLQEDHNLEFFFLQADPTRTGEVTIADVLRVRQNFGQSGVGFTGGDVNYDGIVDLADLLIVRGKFGYVLPGGGGEGGGRSIFDGGGSGGGAGGGIAGVFGDGPRIGGDLLLDDDDRSGSRANVLRL